MRGKYDLASLHNTNLIFFQSALNSIYWLIKNDHVNTQALNFLDKILSNYRNLGAHELSYEYSIQT